MVDQALLHGSRVMLEWATFKHGLVR
jgi:hypothetical protein